MRDDAPATFARSHTGAAGMLGSGELIGVEQEFEIRAGGRPLDFRDIVHDLATAHGYACRAGPAGYYLRSGTLLICDGSEAELAAPPELIAPGLFRRLPSLARARQRELCDALRAYRRRHRGETLRISGYSTHLSASCTATDVVALARLYARTMAPVMMLMLDLATSPGLIVRPRCRRLEVGGEYVPPDEFLACAGMFFVASFLAVADALVGRTEASLPLHFDASRFEATVQRSGWYVDRRAFGEDLYRDGRNARLRLSDGRTIRAQSALEICWDYARTYVDALSDADERALVSSAVTGSRPLPCEVDDPAGHVRVDCRPRIGATRAHAPVPDAEGARPSHPLAACLAPRRIGARRVHPALVTWDYIVYRVDERAASFYVNVPRRELPQWLEVVERGRLPPWADARRAGRRLLDSEGQAEDVGTYARVDLETLAARFGAAKGRKKKSEPHVCEVAVDGKTTWICVPRTREVLTAIGEQEPAQCDWTFAHDVWAHNGAFHHSHLDHEVHTLGFNFAFLRAYRSSIRYDGILGQNWEHFYNIRVVPEPAPGSRRTPEGWCERYAPGLRSGPLQYYHGNGRVTRHAFASWEERSVRWCDAEFTAIVSTYAQNDGESFEIQRYAVISGTPPAVVGEPIFYRIRVRGGTRILLNCHGYVVQIRDRNLNAMRFYYGFPSNPNTGYYVLRRIVDTLGQTYRLDYVTVNGVPRIEFLRDPWGREVQYHYDAQAQLERVSLVEGFYGRPEIVYRYAGRPGLLQAIVTPVEAAGAMRPCVVNTYDARERVVTQDVEAAAVAGVPPSGGTWRIRYSGPLQRVVRDRIGTRWRYSLKAQGGTKVVASISVRDEVHDGTQPVRKIVSTQYDHDLHFHVQRIVYASGRAEQLSYRNVNLPLTQADTEYDNLVPLVTHHNDLGRDDLEKHVLEPSGGGGPIETRYTFEHLFNCIEKTITPQGTTTRAYDNRVCAAPERNGNPVEIAHPPQRLPDGTTLPATERMEYGTGGALTYYRDADGVEHTYTLDPAGRVESHEVGGVRQEAFDYDDYGNAEWRYDGRGYAWHEEHDDRDNRIFSTDALGHETIFVYDLDDRLVREAFEIVDDPTAIANVPPQPPISFSIENRFDVQGNRVQTIQKAVGGAAGTLERTWEWHFDANERVVLARTPRAVVGERADAEVAYTYNARNHVRTVTVAPGGANAGTLTTIYDEDDRPVLVSDPLSRSTKVTFDGLGRPILTELPGGCKVHREYVGTDLSREWVEGEISTGPPSLGYAQLSGVLAEAGFRFDQRQRLISRAEKVFLPRARPTIATPVTAEAKVETWFTPAGRMRRKRDPAGNETVHDYDAQGRLQSLTLPGGGTITYGYDGALLASTLQTLAPDPGTTEQPPPATLTLFETKFYDDLGRVVESFGADGVKTSYAYDSAGHCRATKSPLSLTVYEYDGFGRITAQTTDHVVSGANPGGTIRVSYQHDLNDNVTSIKDALGRETRTRYNGRDQPIRLRQPEQPELVFTRRADGTIEQITRGGPARSIGYEYTPAGDVQRVLHRDGTNRSEQVFGHDGVGRLLWCLDSNNTTTRTRVQTYRELDSLGRLVSERTVIPEFNFDRQIGHDYGAAFDQRTLVYPANPPISFAFDPDGNVNDIREQGVPLMRKWHQGPGRLIETERYTTLIARQPQPQTFSMCIREGLRYNADGQLYRRTFRITDELNNPSPPGPPTYANLLPLAGSERMVYGGHGMVEKRIFDDHMNTARYDGAGRLAWTLEEVMGESKLDEFDWDGAGQLHAVDTTAYVGGVVSTQVARAIGYPPGGTVRNDTTGTRTVQWMFDGDARLASALEILGSAAGALRTFGYDSAGRLLQATVGPPGTSGAATAEVDYLYDAFGRRVARVGGRRTQAFTSREREVFLFDGPRCILEFDGAGNDVRRYVYDENGALIAYGSRNPATGAATELLPIELLDGSPWLVLDRTMVVAQLPPSPGAGASAAARQDYFANRIPLYRERHVWRPFTAARIFVCDYASGQLVVREVRDSVLPVNAGRRVHAPEGLYYNRVRFYDPELQAFITPDTIGTWGDPHSLGNAHASAANNPYALRDSGHAVVIPILIYIGITALIAVAETAIEYAISSAMGTTEEFEFLPALGRNFGIGLATNWIPYAAVGRIGGRIGTRLVLRSATALGLRGAARFAAARIAYRAGAWGARSAVGTGIEWGYEQTLGGGASLGQIAAGQLGGTIVGTALHVVLRRPVRGLSRTVQAARLRRTRQWLVDPNVPVGAQRFIGERHGIMMLRRAANLGLDHEFGVIRLPNGRVVLRRGGTGSVPFDHMIEEQIAHYHPPGGPWLRHRLPAPVDLERSTTHVTVVISRRADFASQSVQSAWSYRLEGPVRITVDLVDDLELFIHSMTQARRGRREGNDLVFESLADYQHAFFWYEYYLSALRR